MSEEFIDFPVVESENERQEATDKTRLNVTFDEVVLAKFLF